MCVWKEERGYTSRCVLVGGSTTWIFTYNPNPCLCHESVAHIIYKKIKPLFFCPMCYNTHMYWWTPLLFIIIYGYPNNKINIHAKIYAIKNITYGTYHSALYIFYLCTELSLALISCSLSLHMCTRVHVHVYM